MGNAEVPPASKSRSTRASLLLRVRDPADQDAWAQFVEIYGPLVYSYSRHRGLQDADAADVTQDVLTSVALAIQRFEYDASRGRFRGWLFNATRNRIINFSEKLRKGPRGSGRSDIAEQLLALHSTEDIDNEFQRRHDWHLFLKAAELVRQTFAESTWAAFWRTAVEGESSQQVAESLGMTVGAVYIAKSRVLNSLREQLACMTEL